MLIIAYGPSDRYSSCLLEPTSCDEDNEGADTSSSMSDNQLGGLHAEPVLASATPGSDARLSNGHTTDVPEESSIIRCICSFDDDDGLTVLCEICNTWQHIDCYYPNRDVPEVHKCVRCEPSRHYDAKVPRSDKHSLALLFRQERRSQNGAPMPKHKEEDKRPVARQWRSSRQVLRSRAHIRKSSRATGETSKDYSQNNRLRFHHH